MGVLPERPCEGCHYAEAGLGCEYPDASQLGDPKFWQYPQCPGFKAKAK